MKPMNLIHLACLTLVLGCNDSDGTKKEYYANGKLSSEISYKNGKMNGTFKTWYANGQLHTEAEFRNDSLVGHVVSFYENGNRNYEDDRNEKHKLDGISRFWYEDGTLADSGSYFNGMRHGEWREFYTNGLLKTIRHYRYGVLNDESIFFSEHEHDTIKVETYRDGELIESHLFGR